MQRVVIDMIEDGTGTDSVCVVLRVDVFAERIYQVLRFHFGRLEMKHQGPVSI